MMTYLVIGICAFLLIAVIFIAAKPISMGIEARRNTNDSTYNKEELKNDEAYEIDENKSKFGRN